MRNFLFSFSEVKLVLSKSGVNDIRDIGQVEERCLRSLEEVLQSVREEKGSCERDGRETRYEGLGALVPPYNRRLSGCKRAKHDHLLERRASLLRHDSSLSARSHVSLQRVFNRRLVTRLKDITRIMMRNPIFPSFYQAKHS